MVLEIVVSLLVHGISEGPSQLGGFAALAVGVPDGLAVHEAGPIFDRMQLVTEMARLVLPPGPTGARIISSSGRGGPLENEGLHVLEQLERLTPNGVGPENGPPALVLRGHPRREVVGSAHVTARRCDNCPVPQDPGVISALRSQPVELGSSLCHPVDLDQTASPQPPQSDRRGPMDHVAEQAVTRRQCLRRKRTAHEALDEHRFGDSAIVEQVQMGHRLLEGGPLREGIHEGPKTGRQGVDERVPGAQLPKTIRLR